MRAILLLIAAAVLASGCGSVDLVSQHAGPPPVCEVHGTQMHPEWIRVSSGYAGYLPTFRDDARKLFPHHGGVVLSTERDGDYVWPIDGRVRDFVCPDCNKALQEYWKRPKQPEARN